MESHNAAQPRFAALQLLILFSAAFTVGCAGSTGGTVATSPVAPPPPPPPSVTVAIAPSTAPLLLGNAQTFTATVTGTTNTTVSWSVNGVAGGNPAIGTITAAGVYTAPADLPLVPAVQINATSNSDPTKSASAALDITSDIAIALTPASASVILGAAQPFRAAIVSNGHPDTTVRWSISGPACPAACGSLDANGNYSAPQILPTLTNVTVAAQSIADPSKQASATIAILSDITVSLTPAAIGVELGAIQPFHAARLRARAHFRPAHANLPPRRHPQSARRNFSVEAAPRPRTNIGNKLM
jgi:hypothetical protein